MRGQSVGIFPITNSAPEAMIAELEKIVDSGENGLSQNLVKFHAVGRLNAIMVVSKKPALLQTAATWIKRLDRADTARTSVHVYRVKYGEARQIARVLNDMFTGGSPRAFDSADSQIAPGRHHAASSDRLLRTTTIRRHRAALAPGASPTNTNGASGRAPMAKYSGRHTSAPGARQKRLGSGGQPLMQGVRSRPIASTTLADYADQEITGS